MKLETGIAIATLLMLAGGCGGGSMSGDSGATMPPAATPPPLGGGGSPSPLVLGATCDSGGTGSDAKGGIWISDSQNGGTQEMRLLVAETGEFRWVPPDGWGQQIFGTFQAAGGNFSTTDAVWVWMNGLVWLETEFVGVDMSATRDEEAGLFVEYVFQSVTDSYGTFSFAACENVYKRESSLAELAGTYTNGPVTISIDGQGVVSYQRGNCVGGGSAELIDSSFNMYRMEIGDNSCSGNAVGAPGIFSGLAYLSDSGDGSIGDIIEFALSSASANSIYIWTEVAMK